MEARFARNNKFAFRFAIRDNKTRFHAVRDRGHIETNLLIKKKKEIKGTNDPRIALIISFLTYKRHTCPRPVASALCYHDEITNARYFM